MPYHCYSFFRYAIDLVVSSALGADMFDCVFPTRTAVSTIYEKISKHVLRLAGLGTVHASFISWPVQNVTGQLLFLSLCRTLFIKQI